MLCQTRCSPGRQLSDVRNLCCSRKTCIRSPLVKIKKFDQRMNFLCFHTFPRPHLLDHHIKDLSLLTKFLHPGNNEHRIQALQPYRQPATGQGEQQSGRHGQELFKGFLYHSKCGIPEGKARAERGAERTYCKDQELWFSFKGLTGWPRFSGLMSIDKGPKVSREMQCTLCRN